jgi:crotonobetainyl-CoA:carnitine CoA-transferase CaiB-like acyl-CoA transferase
MLGLQADRHWPDVLRAIGHTEWADDPRFATIETRWQHSAELVAELDAVFATRPLDDWAVIFDKEDVWWAPVQHAHETVADPQAKAAGGFVDVPSADGGDPVTMVASPVDFGGTPWAPRSMPPEFSQHTEEVLLELGYDWEQIIELKDAGAIP